MPYIKLQNKTPATVVILGCEVQIKESILKNTFMMFGNECLWVAIDKNGDLMLFDRKPEIHERSGGWSCSDWGEYSAVYVDQYDIEDIDWTKTAVKVFKSNLGL